jgi:competence protein ComEC
MNSLAAAALVVLIVNPAHLFDVGAQLSFLCVAILIWFEGWRPRAEDESKKVRRTLERLVWRNRPWWERRLRSFWRSIVGLTMVGVVIWLLTLPLVVARFHIFSIVALGLNAILWIPMTLSVLSGFCLLIAGSICPPLAYVCGGVCDLSFWLLEKGVNLAHRMPYSHFWIPGPAEWWLWIFYGGLGLLLAFPAVRLRRRWCAVLLVAWIAVGLTAACWPRERDRLDCTFLSMGHGCAVVLELPSGRTMLYDAGQFGSPSAGAGAISEFLWHRGIRRLDVVILSHPDLDHYNALPRLLDKFSVGEVVVSSAMFRKNNAAVAALRDAIKEHGISVREVHDGEYVGGGDGCVLQVLHPPRYGLPESTNANSIVLSVGYLGARILLLGDLESSGLSRVLSQEPQPCAVLLAPHHGSRKSNPPDLARWCLPRWVVFSGDGRWSIPEGESPYRAVGSRVLHTHNSGAIFATIDASGVRLSHFLQSQR